MKQIKRNIVVTGQGFVWEYDFDAQVVKRVGLFGQGVRQESIRDIRFRFLSDTIQTHSKVLAERLLSYFDQGGSYQENIDHGRGIEKIYEVNVPSPFLI